jgi:hypothetical protein
MMNTRTSIHSSNILDNIYSIARISIHALEIYQIIEYVLSIGWRIDDDEPLLLESTKAVGP